ncbi:hypothetical protein [Streptomyces sp. NPDC005408]|uniref:hypothetical protein n=1 Tax=Streptomyces sp. NPDC005408 TaxID=3155341 RepID=UPI0033B021E5
MGTAVAAPVRLSVRRGDETVVEDLEWPSVPLGLLREARPWRTFRWYKGQQHYSGTYWSATVGDHVIYESRLELGRLLFADFAPEVRHVVAQPFLLKADLDGKVTRRQNRGDARHARGQVAVAGRSRVDARVLRRFRRKLNWTA